MKMICCITLGGLIAASASLAIAQTTKEKKPAPPSTTTATPSDHQLPPGFTEEMMQACIEAGTPGEMQAYLAETAGEWQCTTKMWMSPAITEPIVSEGACTVATIMDGRYIKVKMEGEMPGMGPFQGFGIYGYDNVAKKFQASWIDNHSTGIMNGVGELSSDRKTLTWNFTYHCPLTQKPATLREVERRIDKNRKTLEMYGADPVSGKEYKMIEIAFARKPATTDAAAAAERR